MRGLRIENIHPGDLVAILRGPMRRIPIPGFFERPAFDIQEDITWVGIPLRVASVSPPFISVVQIVTTSGPPTCAIDTRKVLLTSVTEEYACTLGGSKGLHPEHHMSAREALQGFSAEMKKLWEAETETPKAIKKRKTRKSDGS
jgi:hypothetical protein